MTPVSTRPTLTVGRQNSLTDLAHDHIVEQLLQITFLAPLSRQQLLDLAGEVTIRHYPPGTDIIIEGDEGTTLYLILQGEVGVYKQLDQTPLQLARRGPGTFFGELALIQDEVRSATVRTLTHVVAIELNRPTFIRILSSNFQVMLTVLNEISLRLRQSDHKTISYLVQKNQELQKAYEKIEENYDATLAALSKALDLRDSLTEGHSVRVTQIALLIGEQLGLSESDLNTLRRGALLHDVGKIGVPDGILNKEGKLTDEEWTVMRQHPSWGADIMAHVEFLKEPMKIVRHHHEAWDGSGYPDGLRGEEIPLLARIFSVADTYDAVIRKRPYKPARSPEEGLAVICAESGRQFDPAVVRAFVNIFPELCDQERSNLDP